MFEPFYEWYSFSPSVFECRRGSSSIFFYYKSDKFNLNSSGLTCSMLHVRVWIYWTLLANGTRARQWMRLRIESRVRDAMFFRLSNHTIWTCPTIWNDDLWYADCVYVCVCMCLSLLIASVWLDGFSFCSSHREWYYHCHYFDSNEKLRKMAKIESATRDRGANRGNNNE